MSKQLGRIKKVEVLLESSKKKGSRWGWTALSLEGLKSTITWIQG